MRTLRTLISKRWQVFFQWFHENYEKSNFKEEINFSEIHENSGNPDFIWGTSFLSLKVMRTMRSLISKRGQIFLLWNSWELWEPLFHMGDKFSFTEIMRTMRTLISKRGHVFFYWKLWELWEPWFQRGDKFSFNENYENYENPDFK